MPRGRPKNLDEDDTIVMDLGRIKVRRPDSYNFSVSGDDRTTYHASEFSAVLEAAKRASRRHQQQLSDWIDQYERITVKICKLYESKRVKAT
jgi:hypothetical protein